MDQSEIAEALELVHREALAYLEGLDKRPLIGSNPEGVLKPFRVGLPQKGSGSAAALQQLIDGVDATVATAGPRCFHFVIGGATPASLAADWWASTLDQLAYTWLISPLSVELELISLEWLKDLLRLPHRLSGVFTTGATMANFVGLAAARQWWGEQQGVDVSQHGLSGLPPVPVLSSGHIHASATKVCSMLGIGRGQVRRFAQDALGTLDLVGLKQALEALDGQPVILIANAGEVNAGAFDPIQQMADLAEKYNAWLHVDGAFGLFAQVSERTRHLTRGVDRADSITVDGHKWLNVPYDCGFALVRDHQLLAKAFAYTAAYLPPADDPRPTIGALSPEGSRRARSFSVWASLRAYGKDGVREMIEDNLDLAQLLAEVVDQASDLERLADVSLNIVCFRYNPGGLSEVQLNQLNQQLGEAVLADGRVYVGTTDFGGKIAFRPAISNWRTRQEDVELLTEVVSELGASFSDSEE